MSSEDSKPRYEREIETLLKAMHDDGVAGGTIGPHGATMGMTHWHERTRNQRFSEKVKSHGYPLGLVKSTHWRRDRLMAEHRARIDGMTADQRATQGAVHEALAWALDAERFLGSFNRGEPGRFPAATVDETVDHLLVWLRERGHGVFPIDDDEPNDHPARQAVLYIDVFSGMILDRPTHDLYCRIHTDRQKHAAASPTGPLNEIAAQWCAGLRLSTRQKGESPPPSGKTGQYGRYGCVLMESASNTSGTTQDVCCFVYEPQHFGRFVRELVGSRFVRFVHAKVTNVDVVERISGLHTVSRFDLGIELDTDVTEVECATDVPAALAWGRNHARALVADDIT